MTDRNTLAFNQDEARRKVLRDMRIVDGKAISYSKFIKDYLREMSFTYKLVNGDSPKYRKIMETFEEVIQLEWSKFEKPTRLK